MLKHVDLFSGTGAFSLAFRGSKVQTVFANDICKYSKQIYDANFDVPLLLQDINDILPQDIPSHDILTAGIPCQSFSIAGKRLGFNDPRANVFWKVLQIIKFHKPKFVIIENVKNLLTHDNKKTFSTIKDNLESCGYTVNHKILNTAEITGIPQHRERIYIIATTLSTFKFENFPKIPKKSIKEFIIQTVPEKYYYTPKSAIYPLLKEFVLKDDTIYQYRRVYVRENKSNECPTLTANMGKGGHNVPIINIENKIRKLTPRECFNFQGFPQEFVIPEISDCHLYTLAGNAVSVPVAKLIANAIM